MEEEAPSKSVKVFHASLRCSKSQSCCELCCRTRGQPEFFTAAGFAMPSPWLFRGQCISEFRHVSL